MNVSTQQFIFFEGNTLILNLANGSNDDDDDDGWR